MEDLFGNEIKPIKIYNRDSAGRFSDEKTAKYNFVNLPAQSVKIWRANMDK